MYYVQGCATFQWPKCKCLLGEKALPNSNGNLSAKGKHALLFQFLHENDISIHTGYGSGYPESSLLIN